MKTDSPITPLIQAKLHRPMVVSDHIHRTRLLDRLNKRLHRPLTLVCAPAGYGKSTLVSCWLGACDIPAAWLSLDETDNDLHLFLSYLLAAVKTISPAAGQEIQSILNASKLPPLSILTGILANELDQINQTFILILDDYHVIQNKDIHDLIIEILKYPPRAMHLVLVSRIDPPLPLASLRAKGKMTEIRVEDLRFSLEETAGYLQKTMGKTIEESVVALFNQKSEGWVTGLRLAALLLRHTDDIERVVAGLQGANHFVSDYFVEEILSQQSTAMQDYLLATSILDRFCASLCDAVCITDTASGACEVNGQKFIQLLKKANLFVIPLDDEHRWFRYHHLFQDLLKHGLKNRFKPDDIGIIHTKASTWLAENGHFEEAIQHALKGGDVEKAVEIVGRARHDLMNRDQWHRLEKWLKLFSHDMVQQYLHLILLRSWIDLWHWYRLDYLVKDLNRADVLLADSTLDTREVVVLKAEVAAMRCVFSYWLLEPSHGIALAEQAFRDSPDGQECTQSTAVFGWGPLHQMLGDVKQGERILWSHMAEGRFQSPSSQARLIVSLGMTLWPESETRKLKQAASRLLQLSLEYELSWSHSFARYFLGLAHYDRNELDEAAAQLEIIVEDPHRYPIQNVTHCSFLLSLSYQALGLTEKAREVAESITKLTFERGNQMFIALAEAFLADLDLRQGRIPQANQWASAFYAPPAHGMQRFFNAELTSIKIMLARNTPQSLKSAAEQLDAMHKLLGEIHHRRLMIDVLGMKALLADALDQEPTAFEKLNEALTLAEPAQIIRPFLDLGHPLADLLKRLTKQKPDLKYAARILAAFSNEETGTGQEVSDDESVHRSVLSNQALVEPLTNREIEIVSILPKGLSNQEIAERLFISPETVKKHLYNIYQKYDVKNRQQAIARAKSLGIL